MEASEVKQKFLDFFVKKGHRIIPNASLVPENDSSALFISAGMHPLVPYLLGESYPLGKKLCGIQRCLRTDDIEYVGDGFHHTFFEMLGNWSLGSYWKSKAIKYSWEFLTKELQISPEKISVSCFAGDKNIPRDRESGRIWQAVGIPKKRIYFLGREENWWGPVGQTGPCGPDTEIFFDTGKPKCSSKCDVSCQCGKYIEIWNNVFMQYNKTAGGKYDPLKQRNVDTGMGLERITAVLNGFGDDDYRTNLFWPLIQKIEAITGKRYAHCRRSMRIVADHLRAAVFLIGDGVLPSNVEQGYILRRLLRRAAMKMRSLTGYLASASDFRMMAEQIMVIYREDYFKRSDSRKKIISVMAEEIDKFSQTLQKGLRRGGKIKDIDGQVAFDLYQSFGFPFEITQELAIQKGQKINRQEFDEKFEKHQRLSRKGAAKKFAGGLADHSKIVTRYHTATHLLHQALRDVLGSCVHQVGSNISAERMRFDFVYPRKLSAKQVRKVEAIVNEKIKENLPVKVETMSLVKAKKQGALAFFSQRYGEKVKVYSIGDYSKEVCGGPHVTSSGEIGNIKIIKEKAVGAGRRRIYAKFS